MSATLPAGLLDKNIEFFNDPHDQEKVYALYNGHVYPFYNFPEDITRIIQDSMNKNADKVSFIQRMGYPTDAAVMQKYISCMSGAFDGEADVVEGEFLLNEFWNCPNRTSCPGYGKVCNTLHVGERKALTAQEINVLQLVAKGLLDKEIADALNISEFTAKQHLRNIRIKTGKQNKMELVIFANASNLV